MLGHFKNAWPNFEIYFYIKKEKECNSACTNVSGNECSRVRKIAEGKYSLRLSVRLSVGKVKGKVHPCTGTEALYRPYAP